MAEYRQEDTLKQLFHLDVQPQIEGGNQALADTVAQALGFDPLLGQNVMAGMASPETAPSAIDAMIANMTQEQQLGLMHSITPFVGPSEFHAFRTPGLEYDPSLIDDRALATHAAGTESTQDLAAKLFDVGEHAGASAMQYLANEGVTNAKEAVRVADSMKQALRTIDSSTVQTFQSGDMYGAQVNNPASPDVPLMTATGPVTNGIWQPKIEGFAIDTPARQQMMQVFQKSEMRAELASRGITGIAPTFPDIATPQPGSRPPPPPEHVQVPDFDSDPSFAKLPYPMQLKVKGDYFDEELAPTPPMRELARENPRLLAEARTRFLHPERGTLQQSFLNAAEYIPTEPGKKVGREILGDVGGALASLGSVYTGAVQGLVPPSFEEKATEVLGQRPLSQVLGRGAADVAIGGPGFGGLAVDALRSAQSPLRQGMSVLPSNAVDLAKEATFLKTPTSATSAVARGVLAGAILAKLSPPVIRGALAAGEKVAGAVGTAKGAISNLIQYGYIKGENIEAAEAAAKGTGAMAEYLAKARLQQEPLLFPSKGGKLEIRLKNGRVVPPSDFDDLAMYLSDKNNANPQFAGRFADVTGMNDIESISGAQIAINNFYKKMGVDLKTVKYTTAKGVKKIESGDEVIVRTDDGKKHFFKSHADANTFIEQRPVSSNMIEGEAWKQVMSDGDDLWWAQLKISEKDVAMHGGEFPLMQEWPQTAGKLTRPFAIPSQWFSARETQSKGALPLFSKVYDPMNQALQKQAAWAAPYERRLDGLTKGLKRTIMSKPNVKEAEGYVRLMEVPQHSQQWDKIVRDYKLDPMKGQQMRQLGKEVLNDLGLDDTEFFTKVMPQIRVNGSFAEAYPTPQLPKSALYYGEGIVEGSVPVAMRELDIHTILHSLISHGGFKKWVGPAYEAAVEIENSLTKDTAAQIAVHNYLRGARGWGGERDQQMMEAIGGFAAKILHGNSSPKVAADLGTQIYGQGFAWSYGAHFAYRPSSVAKQSMQLMQAVYPYFGGPVTRRAIARAWAPMNSAVMQDVEASGVLAKLENLRTPLSPELTTELMQSGALGRPRMDLGEGFLAKGTQSIQWMDQYTRKVSAIAQHDLFEEAAPAFVADGNFQRFAKASKVNLLDPQQQKVIETLMRIGDTTGARRRSMYYAAERTNFSYAPEDRPSVFNSVGGRLFGHYGTFSFNYGKMLARGMKYGDRADKAAFLGRWLTANATMAITFQGIFGADFSNYLFLGPIPFGGGPYFNIALKAASGRLRATDVAQETIPRFGVTRDIIRSLNAEYAGDHQGFAREIILSMPPPGGRK